MLEGYLAVPSLVRRATDVTMPPEVRERLAKLFADKAATKKGS